MLDGGHYPSLGERVSVVGFGGIAENDWPSGGTLRFAVLHVQAPLSTVLIWASEPGMISGACNGDAGGPIFADDNNSVIAITAWAQAVSGRGCGGLTQGPLVAPNVEWINQVLARWGEAPALEPTVRPTPPIVPTAPQPQAAAAAPAGRRVALIVANGAYRDATLANPSVDADIVAASLRRTGFAVTVKKDVGLDGFEQAIGDFVDDAKGAEVALFYFAGHGFSIASGGQQQNLLMATDADFHARTGLALQRGGEPLEHIEEAVIGHARATLMFIDACRNIPVVASRGVGGRGFAPIDASAFEGAFVVISTRQGKTAEDGVAGQGSPFARAVAEVLPTPKLRIEDAYARIRDKVRAETSGEQVPDEIRSDLPEGGLVLTPESQ